MRMSSTFGSWDQLIDGDAEGAEHVEARREAILTTVDDSLNAALLGELGALGTRGVRGVKRTSVCSSMSEARDLCESVRFGMKEFWLRDERPVGSASFTSIFRPPRRHSVVAVRDDLIADDNERSDLKSIGLGSLGPDFSHLEVGFVEVDAIWVGEDRFEVHG